MGTLDNRAAIDYDYNMTNTMIAPAPNSTAETTTNADTCRTNVSARKNGKFAPGFSGNPLGRIRKPITECMRAVGEEQAPKAIMASLREEWPECPAKLTMREVAVRRVWLLAGKGDQQAIRDLADRLEGKPLQSVANVEDQTAWEIVIN